MAELVHLLKSAPLKSLPQRLLFFLYNLETNPRKGQDILLWHIGHTNFGLRLILQLCASPCRVALLPAVPAVQLGTELQVGSLWLSRF